MIYDTLVYEDQIIKLDCLRHRIYLRDKEITLTATEFRLLVAFVCNRDIVLSADRLLALVWNDGDVTTDVVKVTISSLRKKLEPGATSVIQTIRGFGYRYYSLDNNRC